MARSAVSTVRGGLGGEEVKAWRPDKSGEGSWAGLVNRPERVCCGARVLRAEVGQRQSLSEEELMGGKKAVVLCPWPAGLTPSGG